MRKLIVKMMLVIMVLIVFGTFQYGGYPNIAPLFKDAWQTCLVGIALLMSIVLLLEEVWSRIRA